MNQAGTPSPLTIAGEETPDHEASRIVLDGLAAHSAEFGLTGDWPEGWIVGRDAEGATQAGLRHLTHFDWLFMHLLWVAKPYRAQGVGSRLLSEAEATAREKGRRGVYLDTFTFQAPEFYRRLGYREFGRLDDFPLGHARIWFAKRF
jgi:GNAT superfamily N-acetyltransferase